MLLDGHIHIMDGEKDPADFARRLAEAGVDGGVVISLAPASFPALAKPASASSRLDDLLAFTRAGARLYPFFWIDPLEADAIEQVEEAVRRGVAGFKVICNSYAAGDPRALKVFRAIAGQRRPILFHSGILWDAKPSSVFNRPGQFESLLEVEGLRFSMAHVGWPWHDEYIAVYGKFLNAHERLPELSVEMFIDTTPGTPPIYRREVLTKLLTVGYAVEDNIIFGSDCLAGSYDSAWTREWIERDCQIFDELGIGEETREKIFGRNLLRFIDPNTTD